MYDKAIDIDCVCPARAGMIRAWPRCGSSSTGLPRTRGDDPQIDKLRDEVKEFAPHARG